MENGNCKMEPFVLSSTWSWHRTFQSEWVQDIQFFPNWYSRCWLFWGLNIKFAAVKVEWFTVLVVNQRENSFFHYIFRFIIIVASIYENALLFWVPVKVAEHEDFFCLLDLLHHLFQSEDLWNVWFWNNIFWPLPVVI